MHESPLNPYAAPRAESSATERPVLTTEEIRAFLGSQDSYYEGQWSAPNRTGGWYGGFNWSAAIFGSLWMFHRRMYLEGAIVYGAWLVLSWGRLLLDPALFAGASDTVLLVASSVATGFLGNALYLRRARAAVGRVRLDLHRTDPGQALSRLGGTSWAAVAVGILAEAGVTLVPWLTFLARS